MIAYFAGNHNECIVIKTPKDERGLRHEPRYRGERPYSPCGSNLDLRHDPWRIASGSSGQAATTVTPDRFLSVAMSLRSVVNVNPLGSTAPGLGCLSNSQRSKNCSCEADRSERRDFRHLSTKAEASIVWRPVALLIAESPSHTMPLSQLHAPTEPDASDLDLPP